MLIINNQVVISEKSQKLISVRKSVKNNLTMNYFK